MKTTALAYYLALVTANPARYCPTTKLVELLGSEFTPFNVKTMILRELRKRDSKTTNH